MQNFAFVDETLDINLTQSYYLSIQVGLNGLSFCILDPVRNKYIALEHQNFKSNQLFEDYLKDVEDYIEKNELLSQQYKKTKLIWLSTKNILVPNDFFDASKLKQLVEINHQLDDLDEIHFKSLKYNDIVSAFIVPNLIATLFLKKYPQIEFYNQQLPFINHIIQKHHSEQIRSFINIQEDFFELAVTKNGQILIYNSFNYTTANEMVYFILFALEQKKIDHKNTELVVSGFLDKKSEAYQALKKFIKIVKFDQLPDDFTYSYTFNKIPHHTYTNLFNLNHCE
ncbi:MAG: DUF3822 family protein [Bacteroidales bacterium]